MIERDIIDAEMQPGLDEFRLHLRITSNDQDALLMAYLKAAARSAEHHIGRCIEKSRFVLTGDFEPEITLDHISPRYYPVVGTPRVKVDGVETSDFVVDGVTIRFAEGVNGSQVRIEYVGGGLRVEDDIKAAILLTASKFFNNPVDSVETLPSVATNLLGQYRRWGHE